MKNKLLIVTCLAAILPLSALASDPTFPHDVKLTIVGPSIQVDWAADCGSLQMKFSIDSRSAICSDMMDGMICGYFQAFALEYPGYDDLRRQLINVGNNGWPIYDIVKAAGGSKDYLVFEG